MLIVIHSALSFSCVLPYGLATIPRVVLESVASIKNMFDRVFFMLAVVAEQSSSSNQNKHFGSRG